MKRAASRPHWRETYVGIVIDERVLEGFIDLLYREAGLVIVDYKTDTVPAVALDRRVTTDGVDQGFGHVDLRRWADGKQAGIEGDVVAAAGPQAVSGIHALAQGAVFHALIYPAISICLAPNGEGFRPQKTPLSAVTEHIQGEYVLPDPGRRQDNLLCPLSDKTPSLTRWAICSLKIRSSAEVASAR